ncbi:MAG TPA: hypothetical protein VI653_01085 [Steroidobacteraceae bacterium]
MTHPYHHMKAFARVFAIVTRAFGAIALFAGTYLLGVAEWLTLHGQMDWSHNYRGLMMACAYVAVGILGLKGPVFRGQSQEQPNGRPWQDN